MTLDQPLQLFRCSCCTEAQVCFQNLARVLPFTQAQLSESLKEVLLCFLLGRESLHWELKRLLPSVWEIQSVPAGSADRPELHVSHCSSGKFHNSGMMCHWELLCCFPVRFSSKLELVPIKYMLLLRCNTLHHGACSWAFKTEKTEESPKRFMMGAEVLLQRAKVR